MVQIFFGAFLERRRALSSNAGEVLMPIQNPLPVVVLDDPQLLDDAKVLRTIVVALADLPADLKRHYPYRGPSRRQDRGQARLMPRGGG